MSGTRLEKYQNHHDTALEYKKNGVQKQEEGFSKEALAKFNRAITELNQIPHEHHDANDHKLLSHCYYGKSVVHHNLGNKTEALLFFQKALNELNSFADSELNAEDKKFFSKIESWKKTVIDEYKKEMLSANTKHSTKLSGVSATHFEESKRRAHAKREKATQSEYFLRHTRKHTK